MAQLRRRDLSIAATIHPIASPARSPNPTVLASEIFVLTVKAITRPPANPVSVPKT